MKQVPSLLSIRKLIYGSCFVFLMVPTFVTKVKADAGTSIETLSLDAQKLFSDMDKIKPDFENAETAAEQYQFVVRASKLIGHSLKGKPTDAKVLLAAEILVRASAYDQDYELIDENAKVIGKHEKGLMAALNELKRQKKIDDSVMSQTVSGLEVAESRRKLGNDRPEITRKRRSGVRDPNDKSK